MASTLSPAPAPQPARAVAYCRVSTAGQAAEGISLEAQEAKLNALADLNDLSLVETIRDEGESARSLCRPGMQRVLAMIERGEIDVVIVASLDRLTRSVRDLTDLIALCERKQVSLVSAAESLNTSTAAGRMVVHLLGVMAQWQRDYIAEKTISALDYKRTQGRRTGTVKYGFTADDEGVLHEDAGEQDNLAELLRLRGTGLSLAKVAAELNAQGRLRRNSKPWGAGIVRKLEDPERARREARRYYEKRGAKR